MKRKKEASRLTPKNVMGHGSYANLPRTPIMRNFGKSHDYRGGICNGFESEIEEISNIEENSPNR